MAVRLSDLRVGRPLPPVRFLVHISLRGLVDTQGDSATGKIRAVEKYKDLIENRTSDLPACNIVPQLLRYHVPSV
jgi:hypothetical protein